MNDSIKNDILELAIKTYNDDHLDNAEKIFTALSKDFHQNWKIEYYLGLIYQKKNLINQAFHHFLKAHSYDQSQLLPLVNIANLYVSLKNFKKVLFFANQILEIDKEYSEGILLKGIALLELKEIEKSKSFLKQWLLKNLKKKKTLIYISITAYINHLNQEACAVCDVILEVLPNDIEATFCNSLFQLKKIYNSEEELFKSRVSYTKSLERLQTLIKTESKENLLEGVFAVGCLQSFSLAYQGENDRYLQALYGTIVTKLLSTKYPTLSSLKFPIQNKIERPLRIGFISKHFKKHSNWKTRIKGWIKEINKKDFDIYCYCTDDKKTAEIEEITSHTTKFTLGLKDLEDYANSILDDQLDVLIYQEIGMDSLTMQLASFRLAPIQCSSWGHPETSGLVSIDYFLSSDLMEPVNAQEYYTEKIVRLPNLSIYYEPLSISLLDKSRKDFSLPENAVLYWCCQNFSKYLPRYDHIFIKILKEVPFAKFVFINQGYNDNQKFKERLGKAFAKENISIQDCCIFLPQLSIEEFATVTSLMDIYLDSIGWSGCNTTLESIAYDLPILTFPQESMRSRHTAAMLMMMGLEDEIATSFEDYIQRAALLGNSIEARLVFKEKIARNKEKLYRDKKAILGLEKFLKNLFQ